MTMATLFSCFVIPLWLAGKCPLWSCVCEGKQTVLQIALKPFSSPWHSGESNSASIDFYWAGFENRNNSTSPPSPQDRVALWFSLACHSFSHCRCVQHCAQFALRPAPSNDLIIGTAASSSRLLMKSGHSIPKIQGLCNWSGSTVCLCEHRFVWGRNSVIMQPG